ncbi:transketolase family protein [Rhizomicrobium electricum]|uniref:Transketolase family protein n=1 Tax=Rhizomicrobium electricum TaxID=480070 RepID=A0ABP3QAA6_9PROT|nr:transketolase C-terminal domain-containing protein [Rhizomicrobium electricum]NIJ50384.1 transketolase [Rhizomicrobium electricum]
MTAVNLRTAYGEALVRLGRKDWRVMALEADLGKSTQSVMFQAEFPDRYFQMGIAEQDMTSTAAGMALAGMIPFVHTFAIFATGRAYDQLRNSICVPNLNVRICGSSAGLSDFGDGKTHQSIEDVALMRAIPHMSVVCPADSIECEKMMECLLDWEGPVYIRINRNDLPFVTPPDEPYHIGKVTQLRDGRHVAIFAAGVMVSIALEAAKTLEAEGISARVVNVSTIKPLDRDAIVRYAAGVEAIVTAEEHSLIGGLGSAVMEALRSVAHAPVEFVGVPDTFGVSAEGYDGLMARYGLTPATVVKTAKALLKRT